MNDRLIEDAATRHKWTKDCPAPDLVGLLWFELLRRTDCKVGEKKRARTLGWSQHKVRGLSKQEPSRNQASAEQAKPVKPKACMPKPSKVQAKTKQASSKKVPAWVDAWAEVNALRAEHIPGCRPLSVTKERRYALARIHREYGTPGLVNVVQWWLTSHHDRATFLRDNGYGVDTLLRKFGEYHELMQQNGVGPMRQVKTISYADLVGHPQSELFVEADSLTDLGRDTLRNQTWPAPKQ